MKLFTCKNCRNTVYFENHTCLRCSAPLGFDPQSLSLVTLSPSQVQNEYTDTKDKNKQYKYCLNLQQGGCNWLLPVGEDKVYCMACELNNTIPALYIPENLRSWQKIEVAKHRLVYSLLRLKLPLKSKAEDMQEGLTFEFLANINANEMIMTGHENGVITLNISEADEVELVRHKHDLGENYRTLLGHLRHEIGHYYWDRLIANGPYLNEFRAVFGDEQQDYAKALEAYYAGTPPVDWMNRYISMYATSHPWEDWAETFAHYLHMMDTMETAYSFGISIDPEEVRDATMEADIHKNPYEVEKFEKILKMWLPLTFAVNSLNRSMGYADFYPFVISKEVEKKLAFIHDVCRKAIKKPSLMSFAS